MKIQRLKSGFPLSEYAPTWNFPVGNDTWNETKKIDKIREWLIDNETRILNEFEPRHDGDTGLGYGSVTSRFGQYNLFNFIGFFLLYYFFLITYIILFICNIY